jgi:hypothetical protein
MNTLIRFFALFVAIAGLACATLAPANPKIRFSHNSVAVTDPGPLITLPGPVRCQSSGSCIAPTSPSR